MNLSSLVHARKQEHSSHPHSVYATTNTQTMASLHKAQYAAQPMANYAYMNTVPQAPPSPPVEETPKCSLPSISSLLGLTEGQTPPQEPQQQTPQQSQQTAQSPYERSQYVPAPPSAPLSAGLQRPNLPPTPPMHSGSEFDNASSNGRHSPSAQSTYSVASSAPGYYFAPAINNMEPHTQRQQPQMPQMPVRRVSMPYGAPQHQQSASYYVNNSPQSMSSYYAGSPQPQQQHAGQISGLYYQRPLPQQFPPPLMPLSAMQHPAPSGANPWQHHHYISPSSSAAFPPSQDRYICQTCSKAFSRPSSLRIHSHSHTGEKPFKCPQRGCGKAFSVRSNMKRHERGCHSFEEVAGQRNMSL